MILNLGFTGNQGFPDEKPAFSDESHCMGSWLYRGPYKMANTFYQGDLLNPFF
jgi:hypothetical protein